MAQFEHMPEIDKSLREFLASCQELTDIVGNRIFYFRPSMPNGKEPAVPCIFFRRSGGLYGGYRYYFTVRAKTPETLASLRRITIKRLLAPISLSTGENVVESYLEGQLMDGGDENVGWYESSWYLVIEMLECGYG